MTLGDLITKYREDNDLSQRQFAAKCDLSNAYISLLEKGENPRTGQPIVPNITQYKKLARGMKMSINELFAAIEDAPIDISVSESEDFDNIYPIDLHRFPLVGEIACGKPIYADEDRESYVMAGTAIHADFCLRAKGDSMINARIYDGDIVFIRKDEELINGEIYAVAIGDEATLKRVYLDKEKNTVQLVAENPKYQPLVYFGDELNTIHILGKAIAFQSDIR